VTLRENTERPETEDVGANVKAGVCVIEKPKNDQANVIEGQWLEEPFW